MRPSFQEQPCYVAGIMAPASNHSEVIALGIETSCDDTAAAIVRRQANGAYTILADQVWSQHADHEAYGGVVPEIAARSHVERVDRVIAAALEHANISPDDLDVIAATAGPGLVGGVLVGFTTGKALALQHGKPLIPVNHLEGHALSVKLTDDVPFPFLLLLVSGGHTQLIAVDALDCYQRLGATIDDAAGEAFDKTAKLLGLGQPGGPKIEAAAQSGDPKAFAFPTPLAKRAGVDFSFSGLKTAVRETAARAAPLTEKTKANIAASFQAAAARHLVTQTAKAMNHADFAPEDRRLVVAGGVAANKTIQTGLQEICDRDGWRLIVPQAQYCTDNGAMIAAAGAERFAAFGSPNFADTLALAPRARWPLAPPIPGAEIGGGRKGPKA